MERLECGVLPIKEETVEVVNTTLQKRISERSEAIKVPKISRQGSATESELTETSGQYCHVWTRGLLVGQSTGLRQNPNSQRLHRRGWGCRPARAACSGAACRHEAQAGLAMSSEASYAVRAGREVAKDRLNCSSFFLSCSRRRANTGLNRVVRVSNHMQNKKCGCVDTDLSLNGIISLEMSVKICNMTNKAISPQECTVQ